MRHREQAQLIVREYQNCTGVEGRKRAQYAVDLLARGTAEADREADDILGHLATLVPDALVEIHPELIERGVIYPGFLFRGSSPQARDELIRRVMLPQMPSSERSHLLAALAWIGDPDVQQLFARFSRVPPPWRGDLFLPPEDYALLAGWHLTAREGRRDLISSTCYQLIPAADSPEAISPVGTTAPHEDTCAWCGLALVTLLDLDLRSGTMSFLGLPGERLRVALCERCSYEGTTYTAIDLRGGSRWSPRNVRPRFTGPNDSYIPWPRRALVLGPQRRTPIEANLLARHGLAGASQVGGYPSWIQDAEYPTCPECRRPMPFVGQVAWGDLDTWEGITYAFVCADCGVAATNYQQT